MIRFDLYEGVTRSWLADVVKINETSEYSDGPLAMLYDRWRASSNGGLQLAQALVAAAQESGVLFSEQGATISLTPEHTGNTSLYDACSVSVKAPFEGQAGRSVSLTGDRLIYETFVEEGLFGIDAAIHVLTRVVSEGNWIFTNLDEFYAAR